VQGVHTLNNTLKTIASVAVRTSSKLKRPCLNLPGQRTLAIYLKLHPWYLEVGNFVKKQKLPYTQTTLSGKPYPEDTNGPCD